MLVGSPLILGMVLVPPRQAQSREDAPGDIRGLFMGERGARQGADRQCPLGACWFNHLFEVIAPSNRRSAGPWRLGSRWENGCK